MCSPFTLPTAPAHSVWSRQFGFFALPALVIHTGHTCKATLVLAKLIQYLENQRLFLSHRIIIIILQSSINNSEGNQNNPLHVHKYPCVCFSNVRIKAGKTLPITLVNVEILTTYR